jgi:hypothetical protein
VTAFGLSGRPTPASNALINWWGKASLGSEGMAAEEVCAALSRAGGDTASAAVSLILSATADLRERLCELEPTPQGKTMISKGVQTDEIRTARMNMVGCEPNAEDLKETRKIAHKSKSIQGEKLWTQLNQKTHQLPTIVPIVETHLGEEMDTQQKDWSWVSKEQQDTAIKMNAAVDFEWQEGDAALRDKFKDSKVNLGNEKGIAQNIFHRRNKLKHEEFSRIEKEICTSKQVKGPKLRAQQPRKSSILTILKDSRRRHSLMNGRYNSVFAGRMARNKSIRTAAAELLHNGANCKIGGANRRKIVSITPQTADELSSLEESTLSASSSSSVASTPPSPVLPQMQARSNSSQATLDSST